MSAGGLRVLNVDGDEAGRYATSRALQLAGFEVLEASCGEEALRMVREVPDLLVVSERLPDIAGSELCRRLKLDSDFPFIPVLLLSDAEPVERLAEESLESGVDGHLIRPVEPLVLAAAARSLVRMSQAEREIRFRSRQWQATFDSISDGVCLVDLEGRITRCNKTLCSFLGKGLGELVGRDFSEVLREFCGHACFPDMKEEGGEAGRQSVEIEARGRWFQCTAEPLRDEKGSLMGAVYTMRETTERVRAQRRLEALNETLLGLGPDPQVNVGRLVDACRDILGVSLVAYCRKEGDAWRAHFDVEGDGRVRESQVELENIADLLSGRLYGEEVRPLHLRGADELERLGIPAEEGFDSLLAFPVDYAGTRLGCFLLLGSRSEAFSPEEVEMAGMIARALKVEEERRIHEENLRDLVEVTSHELRHPITVIKGFIATLKDIWDRMEERERWELLEMIDKGADRLTRMVNQLIDTSRIESGLLKAVPREAVLQKVVLAAVEEARKVAVGRDFVLRLPEEEIGGRVDVERCVQLLVILLENAAKFSPSDSLVEVEMREERGAGGRSVTVSVMDRGSGIPEEERERIFQRFYQVGDVLHHSIPGIGLGLYIARRIAESHGGCIWCEPRPGGGSVFSFRLPL